MPERTVRRAYRALTHLYPALFRGEFGIDMEETFIDRYREAQARGAAATFAYLLVAVADAVANGLRERFTFSSSDMHWNDLRYALRLLTRSPFFSALTIGVLAGGLGLSIFTFSFLYTAMLKPLPLSGGESIVRVAATMNGRITPFDAVDLAAIRGSITTLSQVGAYTRAGVVIGDDTHRRATDVTLAEANLFDVAHTRPFLGRTLLPGDQQPGAEPVLVLGNWAWRVLFGADSAIVGRRVPVNGGLVRVVGVMPNGFGFPVASDGWMPLSTELLRTTTVGTQSFDVYARLASGATVAQATAEMTQLLARATSARVRTDAERADAPTGAAVQSFQMMQMGDEGPYVFALLNVLATLILLLACINVLNLLLARANERARETAVRLALGASRGRLVMQSMWESIVLCLAGGALATMIAAWGLEAINTWTHVNMERNLTFWWVWGLDRAAVIAAGGFVTLAIAVLGGVVAARVTNTEFNAVLRDGGARSGGRREGRVVRGLVVTQIATVSVLMFFGVMSAIVAYRLVNIDFGYDTRGVLLTSVEPVGDRYATVQARRAFYQSMNDGLSARPAIDGVLLRSHVAGMRDDAGRFELGTTRRAFTAGSPRTYVDAVEGSLGAIGITLRGGRLFDARDDEHGARVALVSTSLAVQYWPGRSPIGEHIRLAAPDDSADVRTVVGVVSDILFGNVLSRDRSANGLYIPLRQSDASYATVLFRRRGDVSAAQAAFYTVLGDVDPRLAPPHISSFEEELTVSTLIAKSTAKLFAACFGFALFLAMTGTYGLMARSIGQRTREIGIRRALGATDRSVAQLLLGQGGKQLGVGVLVAAPLMLGVGFGFWYFMPIGLVVPLSAAVLVSGTIVGVVLAATYLPTRRALAVTPVEALRSEG
jgi:predicted permease